MESSRQEEQGHLEGKLRNCEAGPDICEMRGEVSHSGRFLQAQEPILRARLEEAQAHVLEECRKVSLAMAASAVLQVFVSKRRAFCIVGIAPWPALTAAATTQL